ncbi:MAG TPA: hypothetical protein PLH94_09935 [Fimbriimonadaceae bacterium]|nr:hypothetical protein [Fimbriimonadaceae bacterium]
MKTFTVLLFALVLAAVSQAVTIGQVITRARFETPAESREGNLAALAFADYFRDTVRTVSDGTRSPIARLYVDAFNPLLIGSRHSRMNVGVRGLADGQGGRLQVDAKTRDGWRLLAEFDFRADHRYGITVGIAQRYLDYGTTKLRITMRSSERILFRIDQVEIKFID